MNRSRSLLFPATLFGWLTLLFTTAYSHGQVLGSPFYHFDEIVAEGDLLTGDAGTGSYPVELLYRWISVNDHGRVAYSCEIHDGFGADHDFVVAAHSPAHDLNYYLSNVDVNLPGVGFQNGVHEVSITNDNQVMASRFLWSLPAGFEWPAYPRNPSFYEIYDADTPGIDPSLPASAISRAIRHFSYTFDGLVPEEEYFVGSMASMADDGSAAFGLRVWTRIGPSGPGATYESNDYAYSVPPVGDGHIGLRKDELSSLDPPMAGDKQRYVLRDGSRETGVIQYHDHDTGTVNLTDSSTWDWVGQSPGISGDGTAVAWIGSKGGVEGLYLRIFDTSTNLLGAIPVLTTNTPINYNDDADPITFARFSNSSTIFTDLESRVNVLRHDVDDDDKIVGDTFIISFIADPSEASRPNPTISSGPSKPLLFSSQPGIWTVRVKIEIKGGGNTSARATVDSVLPVIQLGDLINGAAVTDLYLWDSLGRGLSQPNGTPRSPEAGDHYLAFRADTGAMSYAIRADHLDDDGDGLPNHWEKTGGGIDMDRDGEIDLELAPLGATVDNKDLFLEIDWTGPRTSGVPRGFRWYNEPNPGVTEALAAMFESAPVSNPSGTDGIILHIDAGPGLDANGLPFSQNMGSDSDSMQGGDLVVNGFERPNLVYFGEGRDDLPAALHAISMDEVKDRFFGTAEKRARELVFRYSVLADFYQASLGTVDESVQFEVGSVTGTKITTPENLDVSSGPEADIPDWVKNAGRNIFFTSGVASGQLRTLDPGLTIDHMDGSVSFEMLGPPLGVTLHPGDQFVILHPSSGLSELRYTLDEDVSDYRTLPGNDLLATFGGWSSTRTEEGGRRFATSRDILWRTIAHEFGHTLGLQHGGSDFCRFKGEDYLSLMSYTHQTRTSPNGWLRRGDDGCDAPWTNTACDHPGCRFPVVLSYSDGSDQEGTNREHADWEAIKMGHYRNTQWLGNNYMFSQPGVIEPDLHEDGLRDELDPNADRHPPHVSLVLPGPAAVIPLGSDLTVEVDANDNVEVASVEMLFDINGDGDQDDPGERLVGTPAGGLRYTGVFPGLSGTGEDRVIAISAYDTSGNRTIYRPNIRVGSPGTPDTTGPTLWIQSPNHNQRVNIASSFGVWFSGTDASSIVRARVRFDLNGDGAIDPNTEVFPATYEFNGFSHNCDVGIGPVTGPPGDRIVEMIGEDAWRNTSTLNTQVRVREPDITAPNLTVQLPIGGSTHSLSSVIAMEVVASDDETITRVQAHFDANGDGTNELLTGSALFGSDVYQFFPAFQTRGPEGEREIVFEAEDESGNVTRVSVHIHLVDLLAPTLIIEEPSVGQPFAPGTRRDECGSCHG